MRELFTANGSVFAPRFSPDGQRIRFTVSDAAQNTTSLWEIGRDGSNPHALLANWQLRVNGMLRQLDSRRPLLHFSGNSEFLRHTITTLWALPDSGRGADEHRLSRLR